MDRTDPVRPRHGEPLRVAFALLAAAHSLAPSALAQARSVFQLDGELPGSLFGRVEFVGDVDGDGFDDFAVGAPSAEVDLDGDGTIGSDEREVGLARLYSGRTAALLREWRGRAGGETFGDKIAAIGDANGDGVPDFAIGAPSVRVVKQAAYVRVFSGRHFRDPSQPEQLGEIVDKLDRDHASGPDGDQGDFGAAIAGAGDIDGDGADDLLVAGGASYHWVLLLSGRTFATLQTWDVQPSGGRDGGQVTALASFHRDLDGDGKIDLAFGNCGFSEGRLTECGSVWIHSGTTLLPRHQFRGKRHHDWLGYAIEVVGDASGDRLGKPDLVVGAPGTFDNDFGADENGNYVLTFLGEDLAAPPLELRGTDVGCDPGSFFGSAIASGDFATEAIGKPIPELFVAARHRDVSRGRVLCFAFDRAARSWNERWHLDGAQPADKLGRVCCRGRITAPADAPGTPDGGAELLLGSGHIDLAAGDECGRVWCLTTAPGTVAEWSLSGEGWAGDGLDPATIPTLALDRTPSLGATVRVQVTAAVPATTLAMLLISMSTEPDPAFPHLLVSDFVALPLLLIDGAGALPIEIPADPSLYATGATWFAQALVAADVPGGVAWSPRLDALLGGGDW
ncbi:MAG: VCBS repeat-containing protein [Planctomycetes bacterium]|nr:VCBS repeat-containing protein [Planctomycetota bacterium]